MKGSDGYYKISLRPKYCEGENVEVYMNASRRKLVQFLADIGDSFYVVILDVNTEGYILNTKKVGD